MYTTIPGRYCSPFLKELTNGEQYNFNSNDVNESTKQEITVY